MYIWTPTGQIPFTLKKFGDGQPHLKLEHDDSGWHQATIEARIGNMDELFEVLLAKSALEATGKAVSLDIRYLLGGRMDRRDSYLEPDTLAIIAKIILSAGFRKIRVLDPHSEKTVTLLGAKAVYPAAVMMNVLKNYHTTPLIVAPDKGAAYRAQLFAPQSTIIICDKTRNNDAGGIVGYKVNHPELVAGRECLIADDICDGGRTFSRCAAELLKEGAKSVDLFVTHGIFTYQDGKPFALDGIRWIWTTDSYQQRREGVVTFPVTMFHMV